LTQTGQVKTSNKTLNLSLYDTSIVEDPVLTFIQAKKLEN